MMMAAAKLGLSVEANVTRAVELWERAAVMNDSEGLFMLGWATQYGVGLPGQDGPDPVAAAGLYIRAVRAAGHTRGKAVPPLLALIALRVDVWLYRWLRIGPYAISRAVQALREFVLVPVVIDSHNLSPEALTSGEWSGVDGCSQDL